MWEKSFSCWHFDCQCLACGGLIIQAGKLTNWAPHPKALCDWRRSRVKMVSRGSARTRSSRDFPRPTWLQTSVPHLCIPLYKDREHRGCVRKMGCSHYVKFWRISRAHYKPLTIFTALKIQAAIFPVNPPACMMLAARGGSHVRIWWPDTLIRWGPAGWDKQQKIKVEVASNRFSTRLSR